MVFAWSSQGGGVLPPTTVTRKRDDLVSVPASPLAKPGGITVKKREMYGPGFESFGLVLRPTGSLWHTRAPAVGEGGRRGPRTSFVRRPSFELGLHLNARRMGFVRYETAWRRARGAPAGGSVRRIRV